MSGLRGSTLLSGRWLVPLFLLVFAVTALALRYGGQMQALEREVTAQELRQLRERLSLEQTLLDAQSGLVNPLLVRRLVSGLALHQGVSQAYLVGADGLVQGALSRLHLGQPLADVLSRSGESPAVLQALGGPRQAPAIDVARVPGTTRLVGWTPIDGGQRLLVVSDMSHPLALRRAGVQADVVREGFVLLAALGLLATVLHLLWFRRAQRLARTLTDMGSGHLSARAGLSGGDELALIGDAADRMAEQLEVGQAQLRHVNDIINRSPLVVIEWRNASGWPVRYVSASVSQWGYTPEDLLDGRLHYSDLIHPDDGQRIHEEVARYLAHGPDEYRQSYRIRCADGRWVWVEDRTSLVRGSDGEVTSISGILLDITAQREAEQAQREQADRLRMFYDMPFLGMAVATPGDKRWRQVNDRLCEILGYSREELLGMTWAEMTPGDDLERNLVLYDDLMAGRREGYQLSKRYRRKDGRFVHAEIDVRALRRADGSVSELYATVQDVTDRLQAEADLLRNRSQLLKVQDIARMGSWSMDLRSRRFVASPQALAICGSDPGRPEMTLEEAEALVVPEDRALVRAVVRRGAETGEPCDLRCRILNPQRGVRHLHVRAEFEREDGQFARCVGMVIDETELVEAQAARDRLVAVLESTSDIVSMADPQGRVFYFNRAGFEMLGLPPDEPLDNVIARVHPPWASQRVLQEGIPTALREGLWLGESAVYNARGDEVPMSQLIGAHRDSAGQVDFVWTILRDVSERKANEAALELERTQLAQAQAVAHVGSWTMYPAEHRLIWSDENYRVLGFEPQSIKPSLDAFLAVVHPDDLSMVLKQLDLDMKRRANQVNRFEHRIVTPAGVRHVEQRARIEVDAVGQVARMVGTTMDITDRVQAEQILRETKDVLEQGEVVGRMGSFIYDGDTGVLKWSRQAFAIMGLPWSAQPPSVDEYCACIHPDDASRVRSSIGLLVAGEHVPEVRFRTHPDRGPIRWLRRLYQRFDRSAEGKRPRYVGTLLDITDAMEAEERLRAVNQALEQRVAERTAQLHQANQELEAFSYTVSHDLKAPLRGIDGYSQLLVEEYVQQLDDDGREFVGRIRHGVKLMSELINDLLAYSRMERRDMSQEPVALLPLVQQVLDSYESDIRRQGVQVQLAMEPFTLALDREGIAVVLRNLIGNALKFSRDSRPPRVEIGSRSEGGRRLLWVRDNGVGFDMKYHDRMFAIFQRLHRAEEFAGTGVGLALVAKAVQRMGGRVWAESTVGAGATFFMEFPE